MFPNDPRFYYGQKQESGDSSQMQAGYYGFGQHQQSTAGGQYSPAAVSQMPPPPSYSFYEQQQREIMRKQQEAEAERKRREMERTRSQLKQVVGKHTKISVDDYIASHFGVKPGEAKLQSKPQLPQKPASVEVFSEFQQANVSSPSPAYPAQPKQETSTGKASAQKEKDFESMLHSCMDLSTSSKAKTFTKPMVKDSIPSRRSMPQFHQSQKATQWSTVSSNFQGAFVVDQLAGAQAVPEPQETENRSVSGQSQLSTPPTWVTHEAKMPLVYRQVYEAALNGECLDTPFLYQIFRTSGLPNTALGTIWSQVNCTRPGQLTRFELNLALALIAITQRDGALPSLEYILRLPEPPIPHFTSQQTQALDALHLQPAGTSSVPVSQYQSSQPASVAHEVAVVEQPEDTRDHADSFGEFATFEPSPAPVATFEPSPAPVSTFEPSPVAACSQYCPPTASSVISVPVPPPIESQHEPIKDEEDWADFTSFHTAEPPSYTAPPAQTPTYPSLATQITTNAIDLTLKPRQPQKLTSTAPVFIPPVPVTSRPNQLTPCDVELPPSEEKHETIDKYTALREEFGVMSSSTTTSEEMTDASSPSYDPASMSSRSSNEMTFEEPHRRPTPPRDVEPPSAPFGMEHTPQVHTKVNKSELEFTPFQQVSAASTLPDTATAPEIDDFGDFQTVSQPTAMPSAIELSKDLPTALLTLKDRIILDLTKPKSTSHSLKSNTSSTDLGPDYLQLDSLSTTSRDSGTVDNNFEGCQLGKSASFEAAKSTDFVDNIQSSNKLPKSAVDVMADSVSLGADRYECVTSTVEKTEKQKVEWLRCLEQCESMIKDGTTLFSDMDDPEALSEVLKCEKGTAYVEGLLEIYKMVCRIKMSLKTYSVASELITNQIGSIEECWKRLVELVAASSSSVFNDMDFEKTSFDKHESEKNLCGVCLTTFDSSTTISYGGRDYHPACANFWVNRLDLTLPSLSKPHLL